MKNNKKRTPKLKEFFSTLILVISDIIVILITLILSHLIIKYLHANSSLNFSFIRNAIGTLPIYIIISFMFFYEGIYTHRFDFWHESRKILKCLILSSLIIFAISGLKDDSGELPKLFLACSFILMFILIPLSKILVKTTLFKMGLWKKGVKVLSEDSYLSNEIFNNRYLGYIKSRRKDAQTVFIDSYDQNPKILKEILELEIQTKENVLFIPVFNNYQFTASDIYELTNTRTNLLVLENRLKSKYRMFINITYNFILAIILLPILMPIVGLIALLIKRDSKGPVFFTQKRLGKDGKEFMVYKFRTMYSQELQKKLLDDYLEENPHEIENYEIYCKYDNDPRVTKIGKKLRNTSLDELAQIFNVLKCEMNFIGPRPYLVTEKEKMGEYNEDVILKVKPGITGLWQVSGRNELTFDERMDLDRWYIQNWSLWRDFIIFIKTISVVVNKVGAR